MKGVYLIERTVLGYLTVPGHICTKYTKNIKYAWAFAKREDAEKQAQDVGEIVVSYQDTAWDTFEFGVSE